MRFAISIPQFVSDGQFDPARFRAYMGRAETLGFESAWTLEQPLGTMPFLSPLQAMSYAAACTEAKATSSLRHKGPFHHSSRRLSTVPPRRATLRHSQCSPCYAVQPKLS
jgi:hypothetical protein